MSVKGNQVRVLIWKMSIISIGAGECGNRICDLFCQGLVSENAFNQSEIGKNIFLREVRSSTNQYGVTPRAGK